MVVSNGQLLPPRDVDCAKKFMRDCSEAGGQPITVNHALLWRTTAYVIVVVDSWNVLFTVFYILTDRLLTNTCLRVVSVGLMTPSVIFHIVLRPLDLSDDFFSSNELATNFLQVTIEMQTNKTARYDGASPV